MLPDSLDVQLNGPSIGAKEISAKFRSGRQDVGRQAAVRPLCTQYCTVYYVLSTMLCSSSTIAFQELLLPVEWVEQEGRGMHCS